MSYQENNCDAYGHGGQRVANCTHCKNSLHFPCLEVPPNQPVESYVSPAKGSGTLGDELLGGHPVGSGFCVFGFFLKDQLMFISKREKKEL